MIPRAYSFLSRSSVLAIVFAAAVAPRPACAISPVKLAGALEGHVSDDAGHPQMGAVVQIFDRQDHLLERQLTDGEGLFVFAGLLPDLYSVRVTLATFLPAVRNQIFVQAGKAAFSTSACPVSLAPSGCCRPPG